MASSGVSGGSGMSIQCHPTNGKPDRQAHGPDLGQVPRDVGGEAEEHGVAERQQPDVADQQVEGAGKQREAQHLHQKERIDRQWRKQRQHHERGENGHVPGFAAGGHGASHLGVPNRPWGLIISTMAMMMNMTVLEASG